ncbi:MAG: LamG domain-containing protein, partial [Bacteroidetes bacterium]
MTNNTIVGNSVTGGTAGGGVCYGALANGYELVLKNNLIANNSPDDLHFYQGSTSYITDNGYNIIEVPTTYSGSFSWDASTITGDQADLFGSGISATPALATNNNTDNNTQTIALIAGSVAINAGDGATHSDNNNQTTVAIPSTDQRGKSRIGNVDIGAYESQEYPHEPHGGYALDFDGVDDYVTVAHDAALNPSQITVEAWFYPTDVAGQTIPPIVKKVGATEGYALEINQSTSELRFHVRTAGAWYTSPAYVVPATHRWYHAAGSYDGTDIKLYVNGVYIGATSIAGTLTHSTNPLTIGYDMVNAGRYFEGKIDEVRIWSDIRTQAEIQAHMHKELTGSEANLVAYYAMYDGSGTSLTDNSQNSHTGTLVNGPTWKTSGAHAGPRMALDFDGTDDYVFV